MVTSGIVTAHLHEGEAMEEECLCRVKLPPAEDARADVGVRGRIAVPEGIARCVRCVRRVGGGVPEGLAVRAAERGGGER